MKSLRWLLFLAPSLAFVPSVRPNFATTLSSQKNIAEMRVGELKQELEETYGVSTRSFLEKSELVAALQQARERGVQRTASSASSTRSSTASTASSTPQPSREERLVQEMIRCQDMSVRDLKEALNDMGINTAALLEKKDLIQAYAAAIVDGNVSNDAQEVEVEVLTDSDAGPRTPKTAQDRGEPFPSEQGNNPFLNFGGIGGMGGIADILRNMSAGGGASADPFGGMGSSPFGGGMGDMMGKAQQMMSNPKVREILAKAQSNPSIMQKVQECMSNPASFAKYQNDPDVAELIRELKQYM